MEYRRKGMNGNEKRKSVNKVYKMRTRKEDTRKAKGKLAFLHLVTAFGCFRPKLKRKCYRILRFCHFLAPFRSPSSHAKCLALSQSILK